MDTKRLIPCIYLYQGKAVAGREETRVIDGSAVRLAVSYEEAGADTLLLLDLSREDAAHEEALDVIREITAKVHIPVIGAGHVARMEDIKKLLYAGCQQAVLDYDCPGNAELTREVSLKFGADRLAVMTSRPERVGAAAGALGGSVSCLFVWGEPSLKEALKLEAAPVCALLNDLTTEGMLSLLGLPQIEGLGGDVIRDNIKELPVLRALCAQNGISFHENQAAFAWEDYKKNSDGMVPVIVQDDKTEAVLMLAYMNEEAYQHTVRTGRMTYFSRSRGKLWVKGETSGHYQYVKSLKADCDMDTILARVEQIGVACHTGAYSCFFNEVLTLKEDRYQPARVLEEVYGVIADRKEHPKEGSYTNYLFDKGLDKILKKLGEEASEIIIAAKNPNENEVKYEICDFLYHCMVLMVEKGITWEEILTELAKR